MSHRLNVDQWYPASKTDTFQQVFPFPHQWWAVSVGMLRPTPLIARKKNRLIRPSINCVFGNLVAVRKGSQLPEGEKSQMNLDASANTGIQKRTWPSELQCFSLVATWHRNCAYIATSSWTQTNLKVSYCRIWSWNCLWNSSAYLAELVFLQAERTKVDDDFSESSKYTKKTSPLHMLTEPFDCVKLHG